MYPPCKLSYLLVFRVLCNHWEMQCLKNVGNTLATKTSNNTHLSKVIKNESIEGHQHGPEIRTIVIGEQQKIFLSPRVEVRRVVKQVPSHPSLLDRQQTSVPLDDMEPRIQIISKPMQRALNSPPGLHHVRVIKDGRFYDDHHQHRTSSATTAPISPQMDFSNTNNGFHHTHQTHHQQQQSHHRDSLSPNEHHGGQQHQSSPRKYVVSRQINVISTSDQNVFRTPPVVSSTTQVQQTSNGNMQKQHQHQQMQQQQHQQQSQQQMTSMRPPPPPPPIMHRVKTTNSMSEEPSSSIPDLGKSRIWCLM